MESLFKQKLISYIIGFTLSVLFTIVAFAFVEFQLVSGLSLTILLISMAVIQAWIQLVFFLHLKANSYYDLVIFFSTTGIILILVVGTLWIMHHLNYNMTPEQMNNQLMKMENYK